MAEGATCQDMERYRPREGHSLPGDGRGRDLSGHGKKPTELGALTLWRRQSESCQDTERNQQSERHSLPGQGRGTDLSRHGKKPPKRCALTTCRRQRERLVRRGKGSDRSRSTHVLETVEGEAFQNTERNRPSKGHSLPGHGRGRDLSGQGKKLTESRALTSWRA